MNKPTKTDVSFTSQIFGFILRVMSSLIGAVLLTII